jgi:peptide/nickel transport system ATP-binding protein
MTSGELLKIDRLRTHFFTPDGVVRAVDDVSFEIASRQTLGIVGESGCGKSVTAYSILRLLPKSSKIVDGRILFKRRGQDTQVDLATVDPGGDLIREIRGNEIAMVFQEPMTSLSPVHTIGDQIGEAIQLHQHLPAHEARERAIDILERVGFPGAKQRLDNYPHQLSGGLRQRAMIAMALSCNPSLLIADEPTTALDVTIQAQILELMKSLQDQFQMAILLITHNLGVIAEMADRVADDISPPASPLYDRIAPFHAAPRGRDARRTHADSGERSGPVLDPSGLRFLPAVPRAEARFMPRPWRSTTGRGRAGTFCAMHALRVMSRE